MRKRAIRLVDVELGIVNVFVNWLYTQQLPQGEQWLSVAEVKEEADVDEAVDLLIMKAIVFGDRFLAPAFKAQTSYQILVRLRDRSPSFAIIIYAFGNLPATTKLLDWLVERHCRFWKPSPDDASAKKQEAQLPRDFLLRVMRKHGERNEDVSARGNTVEGDDAQSPSQSHTNNAAVEEDDIIDSDAASDSNTDPAMNPETDSASILNPDTASEPDHDFDSNGDSGSEGDAAIDELIYVGRGSRTQNSC